MDRQQGATARNSRQGRGLTFKLEEGELLFLALATCYCNDIYREAKERGLQVSSVEVEVTGSFDSKGEPAEDIPDRAAVKSNASREEVLELMRYTDSVAEIHNTLRRGTPVILGEDRVLEVRSAE